MKFYTLTLLAIILGFVSFFQTSIHVAYKQSSLQTEKITSPWTLVGNKENGISKKSFVTTDNIHLIFLLISHKNAESFYKISTNTYYLPVHSLKYPKRFFLLI